MKSQKKMWEVQHTTICKVVGMALDLEDLKKIFRKFGLRSEDSHVDEEFVFHSAIVRMCGEENKISRHVQKLMEKRFSPYASRLAQQDAGQIAEHILKGDENSGVPLWAILWYVANNRLSDGEGIETALFGRIHMLEHQLLKDFWNKTAEDRDKQERRHREEINNLRRELIMFRSLTTKLEKTNQRLKNRLSTSNGCLESASSACTIKQQGAGGVQDKKFERLRLLLEESREKSQKLEEECTQAKKQIEALTREVVSAETTNSPPLDQAARDIGACPLSGCLQGKRIAMVGGIDSLETHYKNLVENSGGEFCRHDGRCCRGERKLDECIRNADLVVCPVGVNSHFGATGVKKVCKRHGISCRFPDSAGLGSLRTILLQHFTRDQEIPRDSASNCLE